MGEGHSGSQSFNEPPPFQDGELESLVAETAFGEEFSAYKQLEKEIAVLSIETLHIDAADPKTIHLKEYYDRWEDAKRKLLSLRTRFTAHTGQGNLLLFEQNERASVDLQPQTAQFNRKLDELGETLAAINEQFKKLQRKIMGAKQMRFTLDEEAQGH